MVPAKPKRPTKEMVLNFRVLPEIKAALEDAAKLDDRSMSSLAARILREWLEAKGHLPPQVPASATKATKKARRSR
jgi:hypothetical protein